MMGIILQSRALEAVVALVAAAWCGLVVWKSIDYVITVRRDRREREQDLDT